MHFIPNEQGCSPAFAKSINGRSDFLPEILKLIMLQVADSRLPVIDQTAEAVRRFPCVGDDVKMLTEEEAVFRIHFCHVVGEFDRPAVVYQFFMTAAWHIGVRLYM